MADRIQARAIRRCGELLEQIKAASNRHDVSSGVDTVTARGRKQAARDAGLSDRQRVTAIRVARVPDPEFEDAVEAFNPPTVTAPTSVRLPAGSVLQSATQTSSRNRRRTVPAAPVFFARCASPRDRRMLRAARRKAMHRVTKFQSCPAAVVVCPGGDPKGQRGRLCASFYPPGFWHPVERITEHDRHNDARLCG
jgi:hypothetical protein